MAHWNIKARRKAVALAMEQGPVGTKARRALAARFDCAVSAITGDIYYMKGGRYSCVGRVLMEAVLKRDETTCQYCGRITKEPHIDHVIAKRRGGPDALFNLVAACMRCNIRKRGATWIPRNIPLLSALNPSWALRIRREAAT